MAFINFPRDPFREQYPPRRMGDLLLTPQALQIENHLTPLYGPRGVMEHRDDGLRTLTAEFTAEGPSRALAALQRALDRAYQANREVNLRMNLRLDAGAPATLDVELSVLYREGRFPVRGLLEALTAPAEPPAAPAALPWTEEA